MGGDSGGDGIVELSDLSVLVAGKGVVSRDEPTGHDRRTMLPLRSTVEPLMFAPS
jgi:hypothetical protein